MPPSPPREPARRPGRHTRLGLGGLALGLTHLAALAGCFGTAGWQGPSSDHFDGTHFYNPGVTTQVGVQRLLKWQSVRTNTPWETIEATAGEPPPRRVTGGELRLTVVNHATVLIQVDGLNVLTDPIWSDRCSPVSWAGPHRFRPPGLRFEDLPPIDAVVLSHDHYDHLDAPTLRRLAERDHPVILAGLGTRAVLDAEGISGGVDLDWWQSHTVRGVRISMVPSQHNSGRGPDDQNIVLWGAYVIHGARGPVYFAGDTGYGPHFAQARARFGAMRAALLPIGAFKPRWFMKPMHMDPYDAVQAHLDLASNFSLGMHFETFALADDAQDEPRRTLPLALAKYSVPPPRFVAPIFGRGYVLGPRPSASAAPIPAPGTPAAPPSAPAPPPDAENGPISANTH